MFKVLSQKIPLKFKLLTKLFQVTLVFEEVTGRSVLLLPMGSSDDGAHSQNEKLNKINYTNGMKVFANYIHRLGKE